MTTPTVTKTTRNEPERRCLVTRAAGPRRDLIRFTLSPDGEVVPDLAERLGGRGAWVRATRAAVDEAVTRRLFARAFKQSVTVPDYLSDQIEAGLAERALGALGLARRAGEIAIGFDMARAFAKADCPAYMVEASDGAADGRGKVVRLTRQIWADRPKLIGCFSSMALGEALGRPPVMHVMLPEGGISERFGLECHRLGGFRATVPPEWAREEA